MPLNPQLFNALKLAFPSGVKIAKEGEAMRYTVRPDFITQRETIVIDKDYHGEEYRVCCPFCGDTRFRLWINHRWDTEDPATKVKFGLGLANCFNDGCDLNRAADRYDKRVRQEDLRKLISPLLRHTVSLPVHLGEAPKPVVPTLPEKLVPITQLDPHHPARYYLETTRGFNVQRLVEIHQVAYCPNDPHPLVDDRIILPIRQSSRLMGYQARYIGDNVPENLPKYFTMPGMRKTQVLYNYDWASQYPVGVIMEGITDVWSVGGQGVNIFGDSAGDRQRQLIHAAWGETGIILMSDADVMDTEDKRKKYTKLRDSLTSLCRWGMLEVRLPEKDPGSYWSEDLWVYVLKYADRAGYKHPIFDTGAFQLACHRRSYE